MPTNPVMILHLFHLIPLYSISKFKSPVVPKLSFGDQGPNLITYSSRRDCKRIHKGVGRQALAGFSGRPHRRLEINYENDVEVMFFINRRS